MPASQKEKDFSRRIMIITVVVLEILLILATIAFGVAAIATGMHLLWLGIVPCAIAMIVLFGSLLAVLKPSPKNVWVFKPLPPQDYPLVHTHSGRRKGLFQAPIDSFN